MHVPPGSLYVRRSWEDRLIQLHHNGEPVAEERIYNHVENSGR